METIQPLISVIVPVYNVGEFLIPCLNSLWSQTYRNLEILLIDDGSTDGSGERCDEYAAKDPRAKVFHQENGGLSSARNLGMDNAQGEYIAFVDADDYVKPDYFEVLQRDIVQQDVDMACCNSIDIDEQGNRLLEHGSIRRKERVDSLETMLHRFAIGERRHYSVVWASLIRAELAKQFRFRKMFGEDTFFMFELLFSRPAVYLNDYEGYCYIRRASSVTLSTSPHALYRVFSYMEVFSYIYVNLPSISQEDRQFFLHRYIREVYALVHSAATLSDAAERRRYRQLLEPHLQRAFSERARLPKRWVYQLRLYATKPELFAILKRISKTAGKLPGK